MWPISTTGDFDAWFEALGSPEQAEIIAVVRLLKIYGPRLPRPHAGTLKGSKHANMKELRAATPDAVLRVAFAFDPERAGILLCAGNKQGVNQRRFYRRLIEQADALYDAHLASLEKKRRR